MLLAICYSEWAMHGPFAVTGGDHVAALLPPPPCQTGSVGTVPRTTPRVVAGSVLPRSQGEKHERSLDGGALRWSQRCSVFAPQRTWRWSHRLMGPGRPLQVST